MKACVQTAKRRYWDHSNFLNHRSFFFLFLNNSVRLRQDIITWGDVICSHFMMFNHLLHNIIASLKSSWTVYNCKTKENRSSHWFISLWLWPEIARRESSVWHINSRKWLETNITLSDRMCNFGIIRLKWKLKNAPFSFLPADHHHSGFTILHREILVTQIKVRMILLILYSLSWCWKTWFSQWKIDHWLFLTMTKIWKFLRTVRRRVGVRILVPLVWPHIISAPWRFLKALFVESCMRTK